MGSTGNEPSGGDNQPPQLAAKSATTDQNMAVTIDLLAGARDPDGDHLTVLSASAEDHVVALFPNGTVTVTPERGFVGTIFVSYTVSDGIHRVSATAQISVVARNHAPVALPQSVDVPINTAVGVTLQASDPDSDAIQFDVTTPAHGSLTGTAPNLGYTPEQDFVGPDVFAFTVSDGRLASSPAIVTLNVAR